MSYFKHVTTFEELRKEYKKLAFEHHEFNGNEKKKALEYAEELKKQYNLKIIKENWK